MPRINPPTGDPILDALRRERERRGWSQQRLANEIGRATYQTIFNWESGRNEPGLNHLRYWAAALGYVIALEPFPASGGPVEPSGPLTAEAGCTLTIPPRPSDPKVAEAVDAAYGMEIYQSRSAGWVFRCHPCDLTSPNLDLELAEQRAAEHLAEEHTGQSKGGAR